MPSGYPEKVRLDALFGSRDDMNVKMRFMAKQVSSLPSIILASRQRHQGRNQ